MYDYLSIISIVSNMTTEEKARAYDEALKRAKAAIDIAADKDLVGGVVRTIFPESRESEDERIRKEMIAYFAHRADVTAFIDEGEDCKRWISYLEKQKERKPAEKQDYSGLTDLERSIHRGFLSAGVENVPVTIIKETAKECLAQMKPAEWSEDWREEDIQTRFAFYTYKDDPSVLYLSNVFVEETSRNHGFGTRILKAAEKVAEAIGAITICLKVKQDSPANAWYRKRGYGYVAFEDGYDWLEKNLEYLKPAKSAEWSEEDEDYMNAIITIINRETALYPKGGATEELNNDLIAWLKSLRPSWKPSEQDELMKLKYAGTSTKLD